MSIPQEITALVERFERNRDAYRSGGYNEAQVRLELINPFFKALGWDMYNEPGYAEAYKDVVHEDAIKIGGATKAPDYAFRIGGTRKFFVEAKRPGVDIKSDPIPAYQLRRYAWSAKLPLSILTDFEEFAVYDCRVKPAKTDKASAARILYFTYDDYAKRWEEIASIFSREEVLKGSFDRYAESAKKKRGTAEVDDAFLKEIEDWRDILARNIALRNTDLSTRELNFAVQRTIDRIIFLRICEDRGIEGYGQLMALRNGENVYERLCQIFRRADERYNSGLFHFRKEKDRPDPPDDLTLSLSIDDKILKGVIKGLYYPDSPFEFSVLPADILGHIYEQFLGKIIRLTPAHRAVVEDKPEVKKAGGVYYTPTYIVDYIVEHTVGKLLESKTPNRVSKLRILDPACGSGSFLLGAYQTLLDWHLKWYQEHDPEKHAKGKNPKLYRTISPSPHGRGPGEGVWRLTTSEKKRILLNNIYGVDIDTQAVEVTKLSLLLKVLEGENEETLGKNLRLFHERALPDLGENIKCGNSLIGPDFYEGQQLSLLDDEERYRINAFDWETEFPEIFVPSPAGRGPGESTGFDAVIGNPPYGGLFSREEVEYLCRSSPQARKFPDSYCQFMVRGTGLVRKGGFISYIVPNTFCDLESCDDFRKWFLSNFRLLTIWQSGWAFKAAVVDTLVLVIRRMEPIPGYSVWISVGCRKYPRLASSFSENKLLKIDYRNSAEDRKILEKTHEKTIPLSELAIVKAGVKLYEKGKGVPPQTAETMKKRPYTRKSEVPPDWRPLFRGGDVTRYSFRKPEEFVKYGPWLAAPRTPELFDSPKLLMRRTDDRLLATREDNSAICVNSCHVIKLRDYSVQIISYSYLLGLLNSRFMQKVFELYNPQMVNKVFAEIKVVYVKRLPIRTIDFSNPADKASHARMVEFVESMLKLHKDLQAAKTGHDKKFIQRQIDVTGKQIDQLVYELYDLTDKEIRIVEEAIHG